MALPSSGSLSLSQVAIELSRAATTQIAIGETAVRTLAARPSGVISMADLRGKSAEVLFTASNAASLDVATAFGADYGDPIPKRLIVPAGVILGPVTIPSGIAGSLIIQNAGEIQGLGGAANGGAGGHAITASASFTLENTGAVRGGGGGGGKGGTGGQGSFSYANYSPYYYDPNAPTWWSNGHNSSLYWFGTMLSYINSRQNPFPAGGYWYQPGAFMAEINHGDGDREYRYQVRRYNFLTGYSSGGAGGNGGAGQGCGQSAASGSIGVAGGTNSGAGGTGGAGGGWGAAGNSGASGANGNYTAGLAGAAGGAAGRAVHMLAGTLSLNNTGILNGAT